MRTFCVTSSHWPVLRPLSPHPTRPGGPVNSPGSPHVTGQESGASAPVPGGRTWKTVPTASWRVPRDGARVCRWLCSPASPPHCPPGFRDTHPAMLWALHHPPYSQLNKTLLLPALSDGWTDNSSQALAGLALLLLCTAPLPVPAGPIPSSAGSPQPQAPGPPHQQTAPPLHHRTGYRSGGHQAPSNDHQGGIPPQGAG